VESERLVAGLHCGEVLADLTEHLDGRLALDRALRVDEHLEACASCRTLSEEMAAVVRAVRSLPDEPLDPGIQDRLRTALHPEPIQASEEPDV
jgi:anti-sigma factor RsiW